MDDGDSDHSWVMAPDHKTRMNKNIRKLFGRIVAPNNTLCDGTVPLNNTLFDGAVPQIAH